MPKPSVARELPRALPLWASSRSRGTSIITMAPTSGVKTASLRTQSSNVSMSPESLDGQEGEGEGEDRGAAEQQRTVLLHPAGLDHAEEATGVLRPQPGAVDGPVHHALVDPPVQELPRLAGADAGGVHHPVDHVLVEPVAGPADPPLDGAHHHARVEVV